MSRQIFCDPLVADQLCQISLHDSKMQVILSIGVLDRRNGFLQTCKLAFHTSDCLRCHAFQPLWRLSVDQLCLRRTGKYRRCIADREIIRIDQKFSRFNLPHRIHFTQNVEYSHRADLVLEQSNCLFADTVKQLPNRDRYMLDEGILPRSSMTRPEREPSKP